MAKLKICGLTCKEDIEAVNGAKPDFAGFIIEVPGRRRSLTAERVKVLVKVASFATISPSIYNLTISVLALVRKVIDFLKCPGYLPVPL